MPRRREYGVYYGTLARSLAPVYAWTIILLMLLAQPWLLHSEASWLRKDTLEFGYTANAPATAPGESPFNARVADQLAHRIAVAINP